MVEGRDYIGVGVGAIVFDDRGDVFLAKRGPEATNERNYWEFPGGRVEFTERLVDAVHREFREEYDIEIRILETFGAFDHILLTEQEHWVSVTFIARHVAGIPRIVEPTKCIDIGWYPLSALPKPLSKISEDNYKSYLEKYSLRKW